jgi:hypothetical protein
MLESSISQSIADFADESSHHAKLKFIKLPIDIDQ